ncbi:unnamed protein product [Rangifer tarandus platyrhynchus]|uniref:Uncharacterized protein n=2 Tax=Rangifer tarandus platyrhynchus TaxID=3082113 RepID=A0AC59ZFV4_RANTA|nr:unnamed protein product [Rangifer tarandus platyrhynchus]
MGCSPPGSSVHGVLQARMPEWVAMPSSRGPSRPRIEPNPGIKPESLYLLHCRWILYPLSHQGSAFVIFISCQLLEKKKNEERKEGGKAENREGGFKDEC